MVRGAEGPEGVPGVGEENVARVALVDYRWTAGAEVVHLVLVGEVVLLLLVERIDVDLMM